jgi:hypothetical protein
MKYRIASYELCALAVIAFLVDHAGELLFHENLWLRVFRMFGLVWFFPAGYNSGWRSGARVWQGLAVLTLFDFLFYRSALPLCALGTLLALRWVIDPLMEFSLRSRARFWGVQLLLVLLIYPSNDVLEYGAVALMIAQAGWLVRHRGQLPAGVVSVPQYFVFMTAIYLAFTQSVLQFNVAQSVFVVATTALMARLLYDFKDILREDLARLRQKDDVVRKTCRFIAHHTLEIYVVQFLVLKCMLAWAVNMPVGFRLPPYHWPTLHWPG